MFRFVQRSKTVVTRAFTLAVVQREASSSRLPRNRQGGFSVPMWKIGPCCPTEEPSFLRREHHACGQLRRHFVDCATIHRIALAPACFVHSISHFMSQGILCILVGGIGCSVL